MSIEVKQKIKEVADDFAMPAKKLIEIVGKFYEKPKSSSQNLTEDQLNVIFDYITQQNQIDSIEQVFSDSEYSTVPGDQKIPTHRRLVCCDDSVHSGVSSLSVFSEYPR